MRVPLSWLREFVAIDVPMHELATRLATSTCEVERVVHRGVPDDDGNVGRFRVGRVLDVAAHPNADRVRLCQVDVGEPDPRQIVCGAWNFEAGATVCVVLPGGVLPGGLRIEERTVRGERSEGMILSEQELELGPDQSGILVLAEPAEPGMPLVDLFAIGEEVLEVEVTGNRPDLLSVYGLAREVAALFRLDLAPPPGSEPGRAGDETVDIRVEDSAGCPVYIGRLFRDVRIGPSPPWLKARLAASGMRPISNVVDVTNYVMHALGSPLHVFDHRKLSDGRIVVRRAAAGEEVTTLDGTLRRLEPTDLVIADAKRPVALAAIMGGLDSEVGDETPDVLLEAANFEPVGILRTSERLGLRTDGSNRWEKGVDPQLAEPAARLATQLIVELAGGRWTGAADVRAELPDRPVVRFRPGRADALNGVVTPPDRQREILERLGFGVGDDWQVIVPTWRARDVAREIDLVEEIARFELDRVPFTLPERRELFGRLDREQRLRREVEDVLLGCGLSETYTPSLVGEQASPAGQRLPTPLTTEHAVLRTALLPSLVDAARRNIDAGAADVAVFEIARVYLPVPGELPNERWRVGGILSAGFFRAKGVVETLLETLHVDADFERTQEPFLHPGKAARIEAGWLGELHPGVLRGWSAFELDLEMLFERVPETVKYEDVITYPPVRQDLAVTVGEDIAAGELVAAAEEAAGTDLREVRVFDVYRGEQVGPGRKSVALSLVFQSADRTLSDEDAAQLRARIVTALAERFGADLRGGPAA
jgi:phenylalanyl-tRNA synthetase beta chain